MYKLTCNPVNGFSFIITGSDVADLQRVAGRHNLKSYFITNRAGEVVYALAFNLKG